MRNLKKVLSVLLVVAIMAVSMVPAFAAETFKYEAQAKALYDVGLFKGVSPDSFNPDLGSALTREQGFALIVRLLGKADDAAALKAADVDAALATFADAKAVEPTLKNTVAYAVKSGLVVGDGKSLDAKGAMIGNDFATVLLRQLGFEVTADGYNKAAATLAEKGGITAAEATAFATKKLIRDDLVGMSYGSLKATYKTGETVIAKLIADKDVDEAKAIAAGVYTKPTAATVSAKVTGAKTITVSFSSAVDTSKVKVAVKKNNATVTADKVTPAKDGKSVAFTTFTKLTEGDYVVTVSGVSDKDATVTVAAEDEKVAKIELSDKAVLGTDNRSAVASYKLFNQYNEDVTKSYYTDVTFSADSNTYNTDGTTTEGKLVISLKAAGSSDLKRDDKIYASILWASGTNTAFTSQLLTVGDKAGVAEISISSLYNEEGKVLDVSRNYQDYYLVFDVKDQFGNVFTTDISDLDVLKNDLTVVTGDSSVANFEKVTVGTSTLPNFKKLTINGDDKVVLQLLSPNDVSGATNRAGTAPITVVSKTQGKMAKFDVVVKDALYAAAFTMQAPEIAVAGEKTVIPFTAIDQNGTAITDVDDLKLLNVTPSTVYSTGESNVSWYVQNNPVTEKPEMILDASNKVLTDDTTVTIQVTTDKTYKTAILNVKLLENAKPSQITGMSSSFYKKVVVNGKAELSYNKITVKDQYSRDITSGELRFQTIATTYAATSESEVSYLDGNYRIVVSSSDTSKIDVISQNTSADAGLDVAGRVITGTAAVIGADVDKLYLFGNAKGSATITVKLQEKSGTTWKDIKDCTTEFSYNAVDMDDIEKYEVSSLEKTFDLQKMVSSVTKDAYNFATGATNNATVGFVTSNNWTGFDRAVTVTGIMADGSKVTIPYQLGRTGATAVNAYEIKTSSEGTKVFFDKSNTKESSTNRTVYAKEIRVVGLTDSDNKEVTVPFAVIIDGKTLNGTLAVGYDDPKIEKLALVYNELAKLNNDKVSINVEKTSLDLMTTPATTAQVVERIVASAVKATDQYGFEHKYDYANFYDIIYTVKNSAGVEKDSAAALAVGDSVEVTVFSKNNAQVLTFDIVIE